MARRPAARRRAQGMRLAFCLLLAAPAAAAQPSDGGVVAPRIDIKGELRPAGPKPTPLITVPEPEEPQAQR